MIDKELEQQRRKAKKPLLWVAQASIFMAFAGLTSGFIVSKGGLEEKGLWMEFVLPGEFLISTIIILLSSVCLIVAARFIRRGDQNKFVVSLILTLILGLGFMIFQLLGWKDLTLRGIYFTGPGSNVSGSWIYALTFFHLAHVIGGILALVVTLFRAIKGAYSAQNKLGFELAAIFWHFLGGVWLYLYLFLIFVR
jgi:cytochrome c oxidase subunit III